MDVSKTSNTGCLGHRCGGSGVEGRMVVTPFWTLVSPSRWISTPRIPRSRKKTTGSPHNLSGCLPVRPCPAALGEARPRCSTPPVPGIPTPVLNSRPPKTRGDKRFPAEGDCERGQQVGKPAIGKRITFIPPHPVPEKTPATGDVGSRWGQKPPFGNAGQRFLR